MIGLAGARAAGRAEAPGWLRWGALGCGAVGLLALVALLAGALSSRRLLVVGVAALQRRVVSSFPAELPVESRRRIDDSFACVVKAVADGRLAEAEIAPLGRAVGSALDDRTLTVEEAEGLAVAAAELCLRAGAER